MNTILDQIYQLFNRKQTISQLMELMTCNINETGIGFPFGNNNITVTIKYTLNDHIGFGELNKLRKLLLGIDQSKKEPDRHITLYQIHFNRNHKDINNFIDFSNPLKCEVTDEFRNIIDNAYAKNLKDHQELSQSNEFNKMGKFYTLVFDNQSNEALIGIFREEIDVNILETKINRKKIERKDQDNPSKINTYYAYCDKSGTPLYAIQDYYEGSIWHPHASICKEDEVKGQSDDVIIKELEKLIKNVSIPQDMTFTHKKISVSAKCQ